MFRRSLSTFAGAARVQQSKLMRTSQFSRSFAVKTIEDEDELREVLDEAPADQLVIIDWTATWCGPCKMIAPVYDQLSEENTEALFLKCDVDELADAAAASEVSAMPTFQFIKGGELVGEFAGANQDNLKKMIAEHK